MNLRDRVYEALTTDVQLVGMGMTPASVYPAGTDTIAVQTFYVLRYGPTETGPGRDSDARIENLFLWGYNKSGDYASITGPMRRARDVLLGLEGARIDPGWIIGATWNGDSADLFDDGYQAWGRNSAYRIAASGGW